MRLIRQLGDALARIAGFNRRGEYDRSLAESRDAWDETLGVRRELVDVLETTTLAGMLGSPEKLRLAAQLLSEEAYAHRGKLDEAAARRCFTTAHALLLKARAMAPLPDDAHALAELARELA